MTHTKHWITKIVPALAFAAGIIIASVGGIMTLSSSAKLAFFDSAPYSYVTEDQCRYDYSRPNPEATYERSDAEIELCLENRKEEEQVRFKNNQKDNIVDGVSALIVGGILLAAFRKREED